MLLDSNIVIYAAQPQHGALRALIRDHSPVVSVITYIEVSGFHGLQEDERVFLEDFFNATAILPVSDKVVEHAVSLRRRRRMSLGDSIVAATALAYALTLVTHNVKDFGWITELAVHDPLQGSSGADV